MTKSMKIMALTLALALPAAAQAPDPERRWQEALRAEEKDGDAKAALAAFEALAADASAPAGLRARALLRAGALHERLGDPDAAMDRYDRLRQQHPGAREEVAAAEEAFDRLRTRNLARHQGLDSIRVATGQDGVARVTLALTDANVRTVLLAIARAGKRSLAISPSVAGQVTLALRDVEVGAALRTIVETVGAYALVQDPTGRMLRVAPVDQLEQQVELRTYRLAARPPGPATAASWQASLEAVQELLRASQVVGSDARLDPASRTLFVRCAPHHAPGVEAALADVREEARSVAAQGPLSSADFEDANVRAVLARVAAEAKRPLLIGPDVRGAISVHAEGVPTRTLLEQLLLAAGSFALASTEAADVALPMDRADQWLAVEAWPLSRPPAELWAAGGWTLPAEKGAPRLFVLDALQRLSVALQVNGTLVELDPVAHRVVACLPRHELDAFRAALAAAGHVAPRSPATDGGELLRLEPGTNLRTALQAAATARGANVVVAPDVHGDIDGTVRKEAPLPATLAAIAAATGPFEVVAGDGVLRVVSREAAEQRLETRRLPLVRRPAAGAAPLARIVEGLATASQVQGALALHQPEGNFVLASLPAPLLAQLEAVVAACDCTDGLSIDAPAVACTLDPQADGRAVVKGGDLLLLGRAGFENALLPGEPTAERLLARARRLLAAGLIRPEVTTAAELRANLGAGFRQSSATAEAGVPVWKAALAGTGPEGSGQLEFTFDERKGLLLRVHEWREGGDRRLLSPAAPDPAALEGLLSVRVEGPVVIVTRHGEAPLERRFVVWPARR